MAKKNRWNNYAAFICAFVLLTGVHAQHTAPAIEGWRVHLPFLNNHTLCESGNRIFVGSASGIFTFNEDDRSIEVLSKVNGLSDVEVKIMATHPGTKDVLIVYESTNIDIIEGSNIYNINDILTKLIIGEKRINNISFDNNLAYLSCSFGIVVIDMNRKTIIDNYDHLGSNGTELEIMDVEAYDGYLYASTTTGIYRASLNTFNLKNYQAWSLQKSSLYSSLMTPFRGKLYAVIDSTVQTFDGFTWTPYPTAIKNPISMNINQGKLVTTTPDDVFIEDVNGSLQTTHLKVLQGGLLSNGEELYTLGYYTGLMLNHPGAAIDYIAPSGPYGKTATRMAYNINDNSLLVAGGSVNGFMTNSGWDKQYNNNKFYRFTDNNWHNYANGTDPLIEKGKDFIDVTLDPDNNHAYFSSFLAGLYDVTYTPELKVTVYDTSNSTLELFNSSPSVSGTCIDKNKNLWVSNFGAQHPLSVKTQNGQWFSFSYPSQVDGLTADHLLGFITCDDNNYKWVFSTRTGGILVYNDNNHPENANLHQVRMLQKDKQKGLLPSNTVFCITKEQKGEMWVGTDQGLCIFSNTSAIFKANADYDAHQLVIKTGLVYSNFLGTEAVYCIRVDAANRKWIGTRNGVWLVSPDGYTVIKNFTTRNSPLLSDVVYDIGINDQTGEVFFATEKGLISYMGTATEGLDKHGNVLVYPNPVRPDYQGLIAIRGLVNDANVKITDIGGNLVYETKANGGFATWNGLNFKGKRAATGVYLIYSSNPDATETWVGKILFIN